MNLAPRRKPYISKPEEQNHNYKTKEGDLLPFKLQDSRFKVTADFSPPPSKT